MRTLRVAVLIDQLFWLIVGHAVADYLMQSAAVSGAKRRTNPDWFVAMGCHCLANAGAVALATGSTKLGCAEFVAHFAIDLLKCEGYFGGRVDQCLHLGCKLLWVLIQRDLQ